MPHDFPTSVIQVRSHFVESVPISDVSYSNISPGYSLAAWSHSFTLRSFIEIITAWRHSNHAVSGLCSPGWHSEQAEGRAVSPIKPVDLRQRQIIRVIHLPPDVSKSTSSIQANERDRDS